MFVSWIEEPQIHYIQCLQMTPFPAEARWTLSSKQGSFPHLSAYFPLLSLPSSFLYYGYVKCWQRNGNKTFRRIRYFCYFCIYSHVLPQEIWRNSWDDTKTKITFIFCCYTKVFKTRKYMKVYWVHQSDGRKLKIGWHGWFSPMVLQYWGHA